MGEKVKIVMIDDEKGICEFVKAGLEAKGEFEVTTTSDPQEAENVVRAAQPAVLLLDIVMPKRSGRDVIASLKKDASTKNLPIIVISGKGEMLFNSKKKEFEWKPNNPLAKERGELPDGKSAETLAAGYGVDDYVSKPLTLDGLTQVIKDVLSRKKPAAKEDSQEGLV